MIKFRTANFFDIENIMKLEEKCFNKYTQEKKEVYLERIEVFPDGFIILELDDQFVGAVSSEIWQYVSVVNRDIFTLGHSIKKQIKLNGNELYISSIGILPEYRSQGFGEALFKELIKNIKLKFQNVVHGILLLSEEWEYARKIYMQNNFKECKILEGFFMSTDGTKKNGIVMRKNIL
ncbi:N-acetyltransferase GCN5 [Spirochaetia bacterium]|nr:N-acetyltransferase GCN5 [Spirochaetia bacterium]